MEFINRISEEDYVASFRLKHNSNLRTLGRASLLLSTAVLCGLLVYEIVHRGLRGVPESTVIGAIYCVAVFLIYWVYMPWKIRHSYRTNKNMKLDFRMTATPDALSNEVSNGSKSMTTWETFSYWRESERVFLIVLPSNAFVTIPKSCLREPQQQEFRELLSAVLPRK